MSTIFVRPARAEDSVNFTNWATRYFEPKQEDYTLCAFKKDKVIGYLPIERRQFVSSQILDSFVSNPEATDLEIASALRELIKQAVTLGYLQNMDEIYFIGDHPETNKLAERIFQKIEFPVYRLSLKELE